MGRKGYLWEKRLGALFAVLCFVVFVILFTFSLLSSWVNTDYTIEFVYFQWDSVPSNLLGLGVFLLLLHLIIKTLSRFGAKWNMDLTAAGVSIICTLAGIWWVHTSNTAPRADQAYITISAINFENGNILGLVKGEYLGLHRHQLGLVTLVRLLYKIFGSQDYRIFQYFSALTVSVLVFSGYKIVQKFSGGNGKAAVVYLVMMLCCVPMYGYVPFVYGEICSTAAVFLGAWILLSVLERFRWWKMAALAAAAGFAVQTRKNTLIPLIGFLIVIVIKCISAAWGRSDPKRCNAAEYHTAPGNHAAADYHAAPESRAALNVQTASVWQTAAAGGAIVAGILLFQAAVSLLYAPYTPGDSKAVPAILYVDMGTHDWAEGGPGWYNGYNVHLFALADYDPEAAWEIGCKDIKEFIGKCVADPKYALDFYVEKMSTQWNAPMYQCLVSNNQFADEWNAFTESVYNGKIGKFLDGFMNIYQLLLYGGVLIALAVKRREWVRIESYVLLIGIYGGFLFSLLWEAKTRYIFPYMMMMIPYAAVGVEWLIAELSGKVKSISQHRVFLRQKGVMK